MKLPLIVIVLFLGFGTTIDAQNNAIASTTDFAQERLPETAGAASSAKPKLTWYSPISQSTLSVDDLLGDAYLEFLPKELSSIKKRFQDTTTTSIERFELEQARFFYEQILLGGLHVHQVQEKVSKILTQKNMRKLFEALSAEECTLVQMLVLYELECFVTNSSTLKHKKTCLVHRPSGNILVTLKTRIAS